jgi:hypothetical protein
MRVCDKVHWRVSQALQSVKLLEDGAQSAHRIMPLACVTFPELSPVRAAYVQCRDSTADFIPPLAETLERTRSKVADHI